MRGVTKPEIIFPVSESTRLYLGFDAMCTAVGVALLSSLDFSCSTRPSQILVDKKVACGLSAVLLSTKEYNQYSTRKGRNTQQGKLKKLSSEQVELETLLTPKNISSNTCSHKVVPCGWNQARRATPRVP